MLREFGGIILISLADGRTEWPLPVSSAKISLYFPVKQGIPRRNRTYLWCSPARIDLGREVETCRRPVGIGLLVVGVLVVIIGLVFIRRHETELEIEAEQGLPGPLSRRRLRRSGSNEKVSTARRSPRQRRD